MPLWLESQSGPQWLSVCCRIKRRLLQLAAQPWSVTRTAPVSLGTHSWASTVGRGRGTSEEAWPQQEPLTVMMPGTLTCALWSLHS